MVLRALLSASLLRAVTAAVLAVVALAFAPDARADVRISPDRAQQGGMIEVTFSVPDDRGAAWTSQVQVQLPADAPIAEVYPLSADGWAPKIEYGEVSGTVAGIHGSSASVTRSVTWLRDAQPAHPAGVTQLTLAMGALPDVAALPFTVVQTYSDHAERRWTPTLTLTPLAAAAPAGGSPAPVRDDLGADDDRGPVTPLGHALITLTLGLVLVGAWLVTRRRRSPAAEEDGKEDGAEHGTEDGAAEDGAAEDGASEVASPSPPVRAGQSRS